MNDTRRLLLPRGNSTAAGLRRLKRERPDLLAKVEVGEMTAHFACVLAGFRHRTVHLPVDDLNRSVQVLRKQFKTRLPELIDGLTKGRNS